MSTTPEGVDAETGEIVNRVPDEIGPAIVMLDAAEAAVLTAKIKSYSGVLCQLLHEAHDKQAWKALGYRSWTAYVRDEFKMSSSRSYQLVAYAAVIEQLAVAADVEVSTIVDTLPEGQARNLDVEAAGELIREAVFNLRPEATTAERALVVEGVIDQMRVTVTHTQTSPASAPPAPDGDRAEAGTAPASDADLGANPDPENAAGHDGDAQGTAEANAAASEVDPPVDAPPAPTGGSPLTSAPKPAEGAALGDVTPHWPTRGQWSKAKAFQRNEETQAFAAVMDRRLPRENQQPPEVAAWCPAEFREGAAIAATNAAAWWAELAASLTAPPTLGAVQ